MWFLDKPSLLNFRITSKVIKDLVPLHNHLRYLKQGIKAFAKDCSVSMLFQSRPVEGCDYNVTYYVPVMDAESGDMEDDRQQESFLVAAADFGDKARLVSFTWEKNNKYDNGWLSKDNAGDLHGK